MVQQVESQVLHPVVMGRALGLHPLPVLMAVTGGALVGGIAGAFLAVPCLAVAASADATAASNWATNASRPPRTRRRPPSPP